MEGWPKSEHLSCHEGGRRYACGWSWDGVGLCLVASLGRGVDTPHSGYASAHQQARQPDEA
jgi:hypothetical protein